MSRAPRAAGARDLTRPRGTRLRSIHYDPEAFGRFSEAIARLLGTARFLVAQTVIVAAWLALNIFAVRLRWDPYPFILLNLAFSTQAAYSAPLILLAQNRQADRDREQAQRDRELSSRTLADTEYLARELAAIRMAVSGMDQQREIAGALDRLSREVGALQRREPGPPEQPDLR